jgi:hypothetical protein
MVKRSMTGVPVATPAAPITVPPAANHASERATACASGMLPPSISAEAKPRSTPGLASALALATDAKALLPALTLAAVSGPVPA